MAKRASRSISLPIDFETFIQEQVRSGRYASASEVVRAALRLLEQQQRQLGYPHRPSRHPAAR